MWQIWSAGCDVVSKREKGMKSPGEIVTYGTPSLAATIEVQTKKGVPTIRSGLKSCGQTAYQGSECMHCLKNGLLQVFKVVPQLAGRCWQKHLQLRHCCLVAEQGITSRSPDSLHPPCMHRVGRQFIALHQFCQLQLQ